MVDECRPEVHVVLNEIYVFFKVHFFSVQ
jgi:hypothetical protein